MRAEKSMEALLTFVGLSFLSETECVTGNGSTFYFTLPVGPHEVVI
jgi:hypothetical protein